MIFGMVNFFLIDILCKGKFNNEIRILKDFFGKFKLQWGVLYEGKDFIEVFVDFFKYFCDVFVVILDKSVIVGLGMYYKKISLSWSGKYSG